MSNRNPSPPADPPRAQGRPAIPAALQAAGGLAHAKVAGHVGAQTHTAEAHVYGVGTFFHLLDGAAPQHRVCMGPSCRLAGAEALLQRLPDAQGCACLAACDQPVAVLEGREVFAYDARGHKTPLGPGAVTAGSPDWAIDLGGSPDYDGTAFQMARDMGPGTLLALISESGLQGRGGAGFDAGVKWAAVAAQADQTRHVVLNADEGEPGTFKDREVLLRRPDKVLEGLAIAAFAVGATEITCYLRGEFSAPKRALEAAIERVGRDNTFPGLHFHVHEGQGAYICGEETALLEALEGKRGMPRLKPPYPTEAGLFGHPTLIHNVETIACVPAIVQNGAAWFWSLGLTGAGSKLYCVSGHVAKPGVYELPLGSSLDALLEACGGVVGTLKAFSPGGASAGFLPASERGRPLDFQALTEVGAMLGSAGVVVFNHTVDMREAALAQLRFFADESCGQCAPCRIGTQVLADALDRFVGGQADALASVNEIAWEMAEGSICGLGAAAPLPLTSAMRWFPEEFEA